MVKLQMARQDRWLPKTSNHFSETASQCMALLARAKWISLPRWSGLQNPPRLPWQKKFRCPDCRVELHLGGARMSGDDLPSIVKFLEIHRGIAHYLLLGIGESD
jgi:hypothetical protein